MKIYQIWEKIKNESPDVQDMVIATLDSQLNVRFNQIIEQEIKKMGKVYEDLPRGEDGRLNLLLLSDEEWQKLGYHKYYDLNMYRNLKLVVRDIWLNTYEYYQWGRLPDDIEIVPILRDDAPSKAVKEVFLDISYIMHKVYESELIDIEDSTLSNLKKLP